MPQKCEDKTETLVKSNLRLVHSLCKRFTGRGIEYDDLFSAGCTGLVKAAGNFDNNRGIMFSTYAVPVILGEIRCLFRDGGSIKVSRTVKELYLKATRKKAEMETALSREIGIKELAESLNVSSEELSEAFCACRAVVSLTSAEDDESEKQTDVAVLMDEEKLADRITVQMALKKLDNSEQTLIKYRYFDNLTQSETAKKLGISQVAVSRSEKKILKKLLIIIENGAC